MHPSHRLVVTLAPELQAPDATHTLGRGVTVMGCTGQALEFLLNHVGDVDVVVADLGELGDHWTGMRLCKHLHSRSGFEETTVWLMASRWDTRLLQWVTGAGAAGLTRRSLCGVRRALALAEPGARLNLEDEGLQDVVERERADTDALLRALRLDPADWRASDGRLHLPRLLAALANTEPSH